MKMIMTSYLNSRLNFWSGKVSWYLPKLTTKISKSCQTYPNVVLVAKQADSAGVLEIECDITGGLNENAPTDRRGVFEAFGSYRQLVIPIVAHSELNRNNSVRYYV